METVVKSILSRTRLDHWLAALYREEDIQGFNILPDPLGRCLAAAQRAIETGPSNHYAHHVLATALYHHSPIP